MGSCSMMTTPWTFIILAGNKANAYHNCFTYKSVCNIHFQSLFKKPLPTANCDKLPWTLFLFNLCISLPNRIRISYNQTNKFKSLSSPIVVLATVCLWGCLLHLSLTGRVYWSGFWTTLRLVCILYICSSLAYRNSWLYQRISTLWFNT